MCAASWDWWTDLPGGPPSTATALATGMVEVWLINTRVHLSRGTRPNWLDAAEHARAVAYPDPALAERWRVGRSLLRMVLAAHLGIRPAEVPLVQDFRRGPRLADSNLTFNVSHAGPVTGVAVAADQPIGLDVEPAGRLRGTADLALLATSVLTARERLVDGSEGPGPADPLVTHRLLADRVLATWVRKEAVVKAVRRGLDLPFDRFWVDEEGRVCGEELEGSRLRVRDLALGRSTVGALAAQSTDRVRVRVL